MAFCVRRPPAQPLMQPYRFGNLIADGEHRVQGTHRFLKDHRNGVAADLAHFSFTQSEQVASVENDLTGHPGTQRGQAQDGQRRHRLPAAGFADETQGAAGFDAEGDPVDGPRLALREEKGGVQVAHLK